MEDTIKIVLLGCSSVGKTSFFYNFIHNSNTTIDIVFTIGVDFGYKDYNYNNNVYRIQLWDTAGQERFMSVIQMYYRNVEYVICMFDVTNYSSFVSLEKRLLDIINYEIPKKSVLLVGNKIDKTNDYCVNMDDIDRFLKKYQEYIFDFCYCSAKDMCKINNCIEKILEKRSKKKKRISFSDNVVVNYYEKKSKKKCLCK